MFVVRVTTHIPDPYPKREYKVPEQEVPVTLVITGSDFFFGFITSLSHGPGNCMNSIKVYIKRRKVGVRNVPSKGPVYWDETIKNEFFDKLIEIRNRCGKLDRTIQHYTTDKLMSSNNRKGCVLIILDTAHMKNIPDAKCISTEDSIYRRDVIECTYAWPDREDTKDVAESSIGSWQRRKNFNIG
ncbi:hypothetical protein CGRA01v4_14765 [Colletotrichum graminicola]|uniref:Uncharacterized protein n=1 Tax=Colletotrichum graminicola (strain M1.001 / M2 / FGSC 10212) TaxID=645133 RepID=E3QF71_COLGM|nr:uncharacterized protein GLRG_04653 [Colletotrichum graminicola M1.001]EFQ29509.1 hypothetical protein GLRG_04653 [Colletotrichum graminicola M1.001]WDK23473.1 hypothetical protein CGRA01v4_14765 [Colletotrichum graminicola]